MKNVDSVTTYDEVQNVCAAVATAVARQSGPASHTWAATVSQGGSCDKGTSSFAALNTF